MKLKFNDPLIGLLGTPIMGENSEPLVLRTVIQNALMSPLIGDEGLDGAGKLRLYDLALRTKNDDSDWIAEEVATIKERIGRGYGQAVVGPAFKLIEDA